MFPSLRISVNARSISSLTSIPVGALSSCNPTTTIPGWPLPARSLANAQIASRIRVGATPARASLNSTRESSPTWMRRASSSSSMVNFCPLTSPPPVERRIQSSKSASQDYYIEGWFGPCCLRRLPISRIAAICFRQSCHPVVLAPLLIGPVQLRLVAMHPAHRRKYATVCRGGARYGSGPRPTPRSNGGIGIRVTVSARSRL